MFHRPNWSRAKSNNCGRAATAPLHSLKHKGEFLASAAVDYVHFAWCVFRMHMRNLAQDPH